MKRCPECDRPEEEGGCSCAGASGRSGDHPKPPSSAANAEAPAEARPRQSTEATAIGPMPLPSQSTQETAIGPMPLPRQSTKETAIGPMPLPRQSTKETMVGPWPQARPGTGESADPGRPPTRPVARAAPIDDLGPGSVLGAYRILRLLGEGGMGKVFLAEHEKIGRQVAIKLLHPEHAGKPDAVKRFFAEARAVNRIRDDHIVEITDFVEDGPHTYCVMEYMEGQDLAEILQDGRMLPTERVVEIGIQIAAVLAKVHETGMVHRDLKPANVFLTKRDGSDFVKVLDFGIAKMWKTKDSPALNLTAEGIVLGTPEYMSPEQARDEDLDHRVDVYALGLVLFAAITGRPPFTASSYAEMLVLHLTVKPPSPNEILEATQGMIPASLEALILECLEKDRNDRPRDMDAVRERLEEVREELKRGVNVGEATRPRSHGRATPTKRESPARMGAKVAVAGGLLGAAGLIAALLILSPFGAADPPVSEPEPGMVDLNPVPADASNRGLTDADQAPTEPPEPAPPPAEDTMVEIVLHSRPAGASVYRGNGDQPMGETPLQLNLERGDGVETFRFVLAGHESISEEVPLREAVRLSVILPEARPARRPTARPVRRQPTRDSRTTTKAPEETTPRPDTKDLLNPFGD